MNPPNPVPKPTEGWKTLYDELILSAEYPLTRKRIFDVRKAILDRAEEILTLPPTSERGALIQALYTLRLLEETAVHEPKTA